MSGRAPVPATRPRGWVGSVLTRFAQVSAAVAELALVVLATAHSAAATTATSQPTQLSISLALPQTATPGEIYHGTMTATANGLTGCYRWMVDGLPTGLTVMSPLSCVVAAASASAPSSITTSVTGKAAAPTGPSFSKTVTVTIEAVGASPSVASASGPVAGEATTTIVVLPPEWASSTATNDYAGTRLSLVSYVAGPSCWVVGVSENASPPPPANLASMPSGTQNETGVSPVSVPITIPQTSTTLHLVEGGTFVANLEQIAPLRLGIVRAAIPLSISAISCPEATTCVLVGSETDSHNLAVPALLLMTDAGGTWSAQSMQLPSNYTSGNLTSVTCPSPSACLATGNVESLSSKGVGFTVSVALTGQGQSEAARFSQATYLPSLASSLADLSCANSLDCIAVGASSNRTGVTNSALVLSTTDGGGNWRADQEVGPDSTDPGKDPETALQPWLPTVDGPLEFGGINGVGCSPGAAATSCEVAWSFWPAAANTPDGVHWYSNVQSVGIPGSFESSISCPVKGRCFGVTSVGFICAYDTVCNESQILETIPSSSIWKVGIAGEGPTYHDNPALVSISCPSLTSCVAVGGWYPRSGSTWSPEFPLVMSPQLAIHPFFQAPPPPVTLFTWTNAGILLGVLSLFTGIGEVADVLGGIAVISGMAAAAIGAMTTAHGDALGWVSVALGVAGIVYYPLALASSALGVADIPFAPAGPPAPGFTLPAELQDVPTPESTGEGLLGSGSSGPPGSTTQLALQQLEDDAAGNPVPVEPESSWPGGGDDG